MSNTTGTKKIYTSCRVNDRSEFDPNRSNGIPKDFYISPDCRKPKPKYLYLSPYAMEHRFGFKGFWEAPFVILQKSNDVDNIEFSIFVIPEIATLLSEKGHLFELTLARIIQLVQYGVYKLKPIGSIRIHDNVLEPIDIPAEHKITALEKMQQLGQQYGLNFRIVADFL